ncbi:hypothetical protein CC1G_14769 [Coprinopsis cinerea okayama7|uniref:Uncharacterized protein n=1 Tax=Coprinopsis cinerea (strain Okayama-7 / 130 / ATCC MYA-4618 / FGSC 9003) TaxID=240176 RepID=D6RNS9_COPC7|nr:hypothetical protein CC1G_14769 [Coprinopsis cinerea okayama7\|eukprot:XP_002910791.1 hypothetical protein CC1G_14769 [Coprinopsis cinerea okayama7\
MLDRSTSNNGCQCKHGPTAISKDKIDLAYRGGIAPQLCGNQCGLAVNGTRRLCVNNTASLRTALVHPHAT